MYVFIFDCHFIPYVPNVSVYQNMKELMADLDGLAGGQRKAAGGARSAAAERGHARREQPSSGRGVIILGLLIVLGVIAAGVWAAVWGPFKKTGRDFLRRLAPKEHKSEPVGRKGTRPGRR